MTDNFDFSQLKSFKTPENWIETAVNIPQKKKPLPFILRPYVIGTAASLVIVAAAVLTILLSSGGKPPLGNEHGFAVQPAVTVPTEIIEETKPKAAKATEPVTIETQPAWNVQETTNTTEEDDPAVEDATDDTAATETKPPVLFTGSLTLIITPDSPLFGSVYVKLDIYNESGAKVDSTVAVKPILNEMTGYKTASFYPYGNGMNLYCWQTYTLRVYDTKGNSRSVSFTPSFAGGFAVNV